MTSRRPVPPGPKNLVTRRARNHSNIIHLSTQETLLSQLMLMVVLFSLQLVPRTPTAQPRLQLLLLSRRMLALLINQSEIPLELTTSARTKRELLSRRPPPSSALKPNLHKYQSVLNITVIQQRNIT